MKQIVVVLQLFLVASVYVSGVYSAFSFTFDIPNVKEVVSSAIGDGLAPLLAVNASAAENVANDPTGTLALVQKVIGNASEPLNSLLLRISELSTSTDESSVYMQNTMIKLAVETYTAVGYQDPSNIDSSVISAKTYADQLAAKLPSSSVLAAIPKATMDLIDSIFQGFDDTDSLVVALIDLMNAASAAGSDATPDNVSQYVTPEMVNALGVHLSKVVSAANEVANTLQTVVWELFPPAIKVDPLIASRLPNMVPLLGSFNASADSTRISVTQTGASLANDATSAFSSITSNPWNWNNGDISNLTTFLTNFTSLVKTNFTQSLQTGIEQLKANVDATLTSSVLQLAQALNKVYTNISDSTIKSSSIFKVDCVSSFNASLLTIPSTLSRLGNCVQLESGGGSLDVINAHAREAIRKVKDDAIKSMRQLQLCQDKNGPCAKSIFASFETQYKRTVKALVVIADYTTSGLQFIAGRVSSCAVALSEEINAQVQTLRNDFNGCLLYGF